MVPSESTNAVTVPIDFDDLSVAEVLDAIDADIDAQSDQIRPLDCALHDRIRVLVAGVDVDLDAPLAIDDE